jgi:pyridoxine 4-dehydrogenase
MNTLSLLGQSVPRIGFGTMRLPGDNVWGPPKDHDSAIAVLNKVVELGIKVIDTAWYYGPDVSNELLAEALFPYPDDLIIITKLGGRRDYKGDWLPYAKPDELRDGMERDLRLLKLDTIPIVHLRWMGSEQVDGAFIESIETMIDMKQQGKLKNIGLSNVSRAQLDYALKLTKVASLSNAYSIDNRKNESLVESCAEEGIAFLPYFPLSVGKADDNPVLARWADELNVSATQVALAWLLQRSPTMLPIPGTSSSTHLEENFGAMNVTLPKSAVEDIDNIKSVA